MSGYFFGKEKAEKYGEIVTARLRGRTISKSIMDAELPGGISYEAKSLGIKDFDAFGLLETLEGLCYLGKAVETDDSHYKVLG